MHHSTFGYGRIHHMKIKPVQHGGDFRTPNLTEWTHGAGACTLKNPGWYLPSQALRQRFPPSRFDGLQMPPMPYPRIVYLSHRHPSRSVFQENPAKLRSITANSLRCTASSGKIRSLSPAQPAYKWCSPAQFMASRTRRRERCPIPRGPGDSGASGASVQNWDSMARFIQPSGEKWPVCRPNEVSFRQHMANTRRRPMCIRHIQHAFNRANRKRGCDGCPQHHQRNETRCHSSCHESAPLVLNRHVSFPSHMMKWASLLVQIGNAGCQRLHAMMSICLSSLYTLMRHLPKPGVYQNQASPFLLIGT